MHYQYRNYCYSSGPAASAAVLADQPFAYPFLLAGHVATSDALTGDGWLIHLDSEVFYSDGSGTYTRPVVTALTLPACDIEGIVNSDFEIDPELIQLGTSAIFVLYAVGLGVGLIISQVRKLRM